MPTLPRQAGLPFVFVNMAMTADGKIATANRAVSEFGSRRDLEHLYELRATADAVMCGARTVDTGHADLGCGPARFRRLRAELGRSEHHVRVIVSGSGSVDPGARIFRDRTLPLVILTAARAGRVRLQRLRRLADAVQVCGDRGLDFVSALTWLRREWGVERLLCEGGGELNAALFGVGLVRELNVTICPKVFGGQRAPTLVEGGPMRRLPGAVTAQLRSFRRVGDELFLVFDVPPLAPGPEGERRRRPPAGRATTAGR
jgi:riboflavin-specific deaminase-like protein